MHLRGYMMINENKQSKRESSQSNKIRDNCADLEGAGVQFKSQATSIAFQMDSTLLEKKFDHPPPPPPPEYICLISPGILES